MTPRRQSHCRWLLIVLALTQALGGCAASRSVQPFDQYPQMALIEPVPFNPQQVYQCGPAALATVLQFWGIDITAEALTVALYIPDKQGTLGLELAAHARRYGLLSYPLEAGLDGLLQELAAGHPVLVFQNLGLSWWPQYHFAVAIGYDLQRDELILRSGEQIEQRTPIPLFMRTWQRVENWARVIIPPQQSPASAQPLNFLKVVADLEEIGQLNAAAAGYRTAITRWSKRSDIQALAGIGLSNIAWRQGHAMQAENALRDALNASITASSAWNNLAYLLAARGCAEHALQAVQCAYALTPQDALVRQSLQELSTREPASDGRTDPTCAIPQCPMELGDSPTTSQAL